MERKPCPSSALVVEAGAMPRPGGLVPARNKPGGYEGAENKDDANLYHPVVGKGNRKTKSEKPVKKKNDAVKVIPANKRNRLKSDETSDENKIMTKKRESFILKTPSTIFEKAKSLLQSSLIPSSLPGREKERSEIEKFLEEKLFSGNRIFCGCLYISGVPGTGKTATVLEVMRSLKESKNKKIKGFQFIHINALRLTNPYQLYTELHENFTSQRVGWKRALEYLEQKFAGNPKNLSKSKKCNTEEKNHLPCVLLVDELDLLVTKNQTVLYNLFDWQSRPNSSLIVIGIANTIDLPERFFPKILSRMGLKRLSFTPYNQMQIQVILKERLRGIGLFEPNAIELVSRKVAAVSGDVRRALELCRRAVEIFESKYLEKTENKQLFGIENDRKEGLMVVEENDYEEAISIGMMDVDIAIKEMSNSVHMNMLKRCNIHEKIFLISLYMETEKIGNVESSLEKVAKTHQHFCRNNNFDHIPNFDEIYKIGCRLGAFRLVLCESGQKYRHQKYQLNIPSDDIPFSFRNDPDLPWMQKLF